MDAQRQRIGIMKVYTRNKIYLNIYFCKEIIWKDFCLKQIIPKLVTTSCVKMNDKWDKFMLC
jgi:hypothetical protein